MSCIMGSTEKHKPHRARARRDRSEYPDRRGGRQRPERQTIYIADWVVDLFDKIAAARDTTRYAVTNEILGKIADRVAPR